MMMMKIVIISYNVTIYLLTTISMVFPVGKSFPRFPWFVIKEGTSFCCLLALPPPYNELMTHIPS